MSHFYGTLQGNRGEATRSGNKSSGLQTHAAGWGGAISVNLYHDAETGIDMARIFLAPWQDSGGERTLIAVVELNSSDGEIHYPQMGGRRSIYQHLL